MANWSQPRDTGIVRHLGVWCALSVVMLLAAGCQSSPASQPQGNDSKDGSLGRVPAVVESTPTMPAPTGYAEAAGVLGDVAYSFKYDPAHWSADLTYCPSAGEERSSSYGIPAGCATTDFLVGQKARDVGQVEGDTLTTQDGKRAVRRIDAQPLSGMAARIYTLMVYDGEGTPLFGFVTSIGVGTEVKDQERITAMLDDIAHTLRVEKKP